MEQMDFETFVENVKKGMEEVYGEREPGISITPNFNEKLQGQSYMALVVKSPKSDLGVNVNTDELYAAYLQGASMDNILQSAVATADKAMAEAPPIQASTLKDYEHAKGMLILGVVGTRQNEEMLKSLPHMEREDLSLVCRLQFDKGGHMTSLVTNKLMDAWGISKERLFADAMESAMELRPIKVRTLNEVVEELGVIPGNMSEPATPPVYVVTNDNMTFGAATMFYPGFMEQFAEQVGGDFFILPSSIHEILAIPDDGERHALGLAEMVASVNEGAVQPEDRLNDHAYHYDAREGIFESAERYEERVAAREERLEKAADKSSVLDDLRTKSEQPPAKAAPSAAHRHKAEQSL